MAVQVFQPFEIFYDINGRPLDDGFIFIGQPNLDPIANPISVFFDEALTIPAAQPIRTRNGFPANAGVQAQVFVAETTFSISIKNKNSTIIRSVAAVHSSSDLEGRLRDTVNPLNGGSIVGFNIPSGYARTLYSKARDVFSVKDFGAIGDGSSHPLSERFSSLAEAQAVYPHATALTEQIDWAAIQSAINTAVATAKPASIYLPDGKYLVNKRITVNPSLDCATPVDRITIFGNGGHRSYDSGDDMPASISASGSLDAVLDLRACRKFMVRGVGFFAPSTCERIIRFGAEDCANQASMIRVGTLDNCLFYGAQRVIDAFLTSGFNAKYCNISRGTRRGISLNACGDWSVDECFINNIGPILTGGLGSDYYDGAGLLAFGGGGNNKFRGGKVEVCSKGGLFDNVQGIVISEINFDKCKEFALAISGNENTAGKTTNLAYQPRSITVGDNRFVGNGWAGVGCHILLSNTGTDLEISTTLSGNVFARAGQDAIDLLMTASGIFGPGPERAVRANNNATGTSNIYVTSTGNKYNGGSITFAFESYSADVVFDSSSDEFEFGIPCINNGGSTRFGTKKPLVATTSWTPGSIANGASVQSPVVSLPGAGFDTPLVATAPSSLLGLVMQAYVTSNNNGVIRLFNPTGGAVTGPDGTYTITYEVEKWT